EEQARMANFIWDLIGWNEESLVEDFVAMHELPSSKVAGPYHMVNEDNIWIGQEVKIEPGAVLDASRGPIMLDKASSIGANVVVKGPCYVGPHAQVKPMAVVHAGTTIGV